jgi:hypothetical protein
MKNIFLLIVISFSIRASAQITKDSLLKIMGKEACEDISKKDLSTLNVKNAQSEIMMMLMPTVTKHMTDIQKVYGNITDQSIMQKMGTDLGMKLITDCPKFMEFSIKMAGAKENMGETEGVKMPPPPRASGTGTGDNAESVSGTLQAINPADITSISIKDSKGKISKLYWLEYFDNADILKDSSKKFLNKKVIVSYMEKSVYDAAKKDYKTIKVITGIELQ